MGKSDQVKKVFQQIGRGASSAGAGLRLVWEFLYRMRKILLAAPVVVLSLRLAVYSAQKLPEQVGLSLQATGEYAYVISRDAAVFGPVVVTAVCLLLMFCSRRTLYPWLISLFSLALPVLLLVTNLFRL